MEFRLLGEVQLRAGGRLLDVGAPRQQAVLAALVVDAGRPVRIETLVDRVWGDGPPVEARSVLYSHLSRLRPLLRQASDLAGEPVVRLERRHAGYVLDVDPELVDVHRFRRLVDQGRDPQRGDADRAGALAEALGLWRGTPLAGLPGAWVVQVRDSWHRSRLDAVMQWAQLQLRLGHPAVVIGMLPDLVAEYPLVEPLEGLLMRALHAAGRDAEALDRYTAIRQRLADDLGADPGAELRELHQAILRGELPPPPPPDPVLAPARTATSPAQLPPRQLPAAPAGFAGRRQELARLTAALGGAARAGTTVVISAIAGSGGIGKTWLALHWAHQHADRFPDGQLFVNLNGFAPTGAPMTAASAVRGFLDALGVDAGSISVNLDAHVGLYRSLVAGRRVLIVLDNARSSEQVVPLLPGSPTCTVLITSRNRLSSVLTAHGARPLLVDVLTEDEARQLLADRLGAERLAAEPDAVTELLACCGGFPLALSIVVGRAQTHPNFPLAELATELREATTRLGALDDEDRAASLPAVLSWSYTALPADQARVFALLGVAPGPDISLPAAANLTNLPTPQTRALLRGLEYAHLVHQHRPGRYRMHDLIALYAQDRAHHDLQEAVRTDGLRRLVDYYLHTAHTADRLLDPHRPPIQLDPPGPDCHPNPLPDYAAALAWLDTEHLCLLVTQQLAADLHWHRTVWQLAWTLDTFHRRRGHQHDLLATWQSGLAAAQHEGDPAALSRAHRLLGHACTRVGRHTDALDHLGHALTLAQDTRDLPAQAHTHHVHARAWAQQGDDQRALEHATNALHLYQTLDQPVREANALNAVGWYSARLGHYQQARTHLQAALTLAHRHHHHEVEAATLDSLGYLAHHTGHHDQALDHYQQALTLIRDLGNTYEEADTLDRLGQTHAALGDHDQARHAWQQALPLYKTQHRVEAAERIQQQLDTLIKPDTDNQH